MAELVSQRKAAAALDMALSTLQHHIKRGNVSLIDGKVDVEVARIQLRKAIDQDQSERGRQNTGSVAPPRDDPDAREDSPLWQAKTRTETLREQLLQLELAERRAELVKVADIEAAYAAKLTGGREAFRTIADRLAPILAAESDAIKVHTMLMREIDNALRILSAEAPASTS